MHTYVEMLWFLFKKKKKKRYTSFGNSTTAPLYFLAWKSSNEHVMWICYDTLWYINIACDTNVTRYPVGLAVGLQRLNLTSVFKKKSYNYFSFQV